MINDIRMGHTVSTGI